MLTLRLARHGRKKQAFFKIVAAEKARAVQKKYIAELGFFNPLADAGKGVAKFDAPVIKKYIKDGAQVSQSLARLLVKNGVNEAEKFIETRPTKPKKEAPAPEKEVKEEEAAPEEAPAEEETTEEVAPEEEKASE
jgi:small subunit ribosomal protein S16